MIVYRAIQGIERVKDRCFEKRGIQARMHESFYLLLVVLAVVNRERARNRHMSKPSSVLLLS